MNLPSALKAATFIIAALSIRSARTGFPAALERIGRRGSGRPCPISHSAPTPAVRCACRRISWACSVFARAMARSRSMASCRLRRLTTRSVGSHAMLNSGARRRSPAAATGPADHQAKLAATPSRWSIRRSRRTGTRVANWRSLARQSCLPATKHAISNATASCKARRSGKASAPGSRTSAALRRRYRAALRRHRAHNAR